MTSCSALQMGLTSSRVNPADSITFRCKSIEGKTWSVMRTVGNSLSYAIGTGYKCGQAKCIRERTETANSPLALLFRIEHPTPYTLLSSALSSMFDSLNIEAAGSWY